MKKKPISIQSQDRPDIHLKESDYLYRPPKPNLEMTRDERLHDGYRRGLPLANLMQNSGYTPKQLFAKLRLDEVENHKLLNLLTLEHEKSKGANHERR